MYSILIVDDELPALRYICNIIEQFGEGFDNVKTATSGEDALDYLQNNQIDLLLTDIKMHGISGIDLAQKARKLQPNIHIVIISGYGEFEYAQDAIKANVDYYLLKPISIKNMISILKSIKDKLDNKLKNLKSDLLTSIACGHDYNKEYVNKIFGLQNFRFALIRWGNIDMLLPKGLGVNTMVLMQNDDFWILRGRDDKEQILIAPDAGIDNFLTALSVYITQPGKMATWSAIYTQRSQSIEFLHSFIDLALQILYQKTIIGKHQILQFVGGDLNPEVIKLPAAELKQISYFITSGNLHMVKSYFRELSCKWEKEQVPQWQVWHMASQIVYHIATINNEVYKHIEEIVKEINDIIKNADSYGEFMDEIYVLLFEQDDISNKKLSTQELYNSAIQFISENYTQPIGMQEICDAVGISQSYMSRLFRRYSEATFNSCLTKRRIDAAMKLIKEKPSLLLKDVAACVGYEDSSYFTKVFRQYTGKTPSQFASEVKLEK